MRSTCACARDYDTSIVPGRFFGLADHFRLGIGRPTAVVEAGLDRLGRALDEAAVKKADIAEFYRRLADRNPDPETELELVNNYTLLVAVVLSAQATDAGVNRATRDLFREVTTPQQMLALGEEGLKQHIKNDRPVQHQGEERHRPLAGTGRQVMTARCRADRDALQSLPGVGRKTANVVMNVAFGAETFAVDTHVFRVSNRTGLAPGKNVDQVEARLETVTPAPYRVTAHHLLILHGRYVCKARQPECWRCVVADLCAYRPKTPAPAERA